MFHKHAWLVPCARGPAAAGPLLKCDRTIAYAVTDPGPAVMKYDASLPETACAAREAPCIQRLLPATIGAFTLRHNPVLHQSKPGTVESSASSCCTARAAAAPWRNRAEPRGILIIL